MEIMKLDFDHASEASDLDGINKFKIFEFFCQIFSFRTLYFANTNTVKRFAACSMLEDKYFFKTDFL